MQQDMYSTNRGISRRNTRNISMTENMKNILAMQHAYGELEKTMDVVKVTPKGKDVDT
jgi:hypothetical protein